MGEIASLLTKHAEWLYRTLILVGVCAVLWLNSKYVTREEFDARMVRVEENVIKINTTLQLMAEQNKVNERQEDVIRDHEKRIREVERITH